MRVLHCQNCGKAGLAVFQATTPGRPTLMATPKGVYKLNRLPFGLSVSTDIFQREASKIFQNIPNVWVYIDDLLISATTEKEHDQTLLKVIKTARENNVKVNAKKIKFRALSVKYVGYQLNGDGRAITQSRVDAIKEIPVPENRQAFLSFLGLFNYVREFVPGLSNMTSQFQDLLKRMPNFAGIHITNF